MNPVLILQVLAGGGAVLLGLGATFRPSLLRSLWQALPSSTGARIAFAAVAIVAGLATLGSIAVPFFAFFAACLLAFTALLLAAMARRALGSHWPVPIVLLVAGAALAALQPLGLRVLALPKADELPYSAVPASVVKTYDAGFGFESVRAAADGTLYLAATADMDPSASDNYERARGVVVVREPGGAERTLFTTPVGYSGQVLAIAGDGTIYMSGSGLVGGVWRISRDGQGKLFTDMPKGAWPNGLDFGPDGMLYSADSAMGVVWRIDPSSGHATAAIRDGALTVSNRLSLAPGANGLRFNGSDLYVTVSDRTTVLKYRLEGTGQFSPATVIATGIPGDDLAIGPDGSLFVTTHVYDTVVRVAPDGKRSIVGDARQNVTGATDASFGRGPDDRDTLYVATDGGRFTKGADSRGQLVALRPYGP